MKRRFLTLTTHILTLFFALSTTICSAQEAIDYQNWMEKLDETVTIDRLSIPGAHDACTSKLSLSGKTQSKTLQQQLALGVRFFDLRPRWDGKNLYIYHGIMKTSVKFNDALQTLCQFLDDHPQEFLFVIMRHESDGATDSQKKAWPAEMYKSLDAKRQYIVDFSPNLTVKDMRGKILVISRDTYDNGPLGAYLQGGGDNTVFDRTMRAASGAWMTTTTQDMYNVSAKGALNNKVEEINKLLDRSLSGSEHRLFINHASGYSKTLLGISTEAGIKECARTCNAAIVSYMEGKKGPMGFILMDFAGDDSNNFMGQTLIDVIIRSNTFRVVTTVEKTENQPEASTFYTLQGLPASPSHRGLVIVNGKKKLLKKI